MLTARNKHVNMNTSTMQVEFTDSVEETPVFGTHAGCLNWMYIVNHCFPSARITFNSCVGGNDLYDHVIPEASL